ncbi:MAG: GFA family protein [Planctomycetes bacterium]|nr:GFA family protein [Planctomycetota bacterium]
MSDNGKMTGACLCGGVKFHLDEAITNFGACHCEMCRRWTSGPFLARDCGKNVHFEGEENIERYKSSDWAERGFCKICGSNLFYYVIPSGDYIMSVGAFDDPNGLEMKSQIFIDEKPNCYDFANDTKIMTGAEVMALYAPKEES